MPGAPSPTRKGARRPTGCDTRVIGLLTTGLHLRGSTDSELETPQPVDRVGDGLSGPLIPVLRLRG